MANPNPLRVPPLMQTLWWGFRPLHMLEYMSRQPEPFTLEMIGRRYFVIVGSPGVVKKLFTEFPQVGNDELLPFVGQGSLFALQGERHIKHRQILQPSLKGEKLRVYAERIRALTMKSLESLSTGTRFSITAFIKELSGNIVMDVFFGLGDAAHHVKMRRGLLKIMDTVAGPVMFFPLLQRDFGRFSIGRQIANALGAIEDGIFEELRQREAAGAGAAAKRDILADLMVSKRLEELSPQEIRDELKTLMAAGYEPTMAAISWALLWIHNDPAVSRRLNEEIAAQAAQKLSPADVGLLSDSYLDAVCKETLRIIPAVPAVDRMVTQPTDFLGYQLQPGTRIAACPYITHRRDDIFPDPTQFRPERFLEKKYSPYEYYPFGGGNRYCLGAFFSQFEIKIVLWSLLSNTKFRLPNGVHKGPFSGEQRGATLTPSSKYDLVVTSMAKHTSA